MLTSTLSASKGTHSNQSLCSDSSRHKKPLSRSSVASNGNQNEDLHRQVALLKEKAHQSFMQVIQIQQLHDQEIEELRNQFAERQSNYETQISDLKARVTQLELQNAVLDKNVRHQFIDLEEDFHIQNIDPIFCKDESKLDDSSIIQFVNAQASQEKLNTLKQEMKAQISRITTQKREQVDRVNLMIDRMFDYVRNLSREFSAFQDNCVQARKKWQNKENNDNNFKTLEKENKFMSENIKRLSSQKMKAEKKAMDSQRRVKTLEEKIKKLQQLAQKKGVKLEEFVKKNSMQSDEKERSLDLNEFIQQNLNAPKKGITSPRQRLLIGRSTRN